ncbi:MAG: class I SAM-dependent methyltransferase, partial [Pseudomonadota bacterium]
FLIPYLDADRYYGVDEEKSLVDAALKHEVPANIAKQKKPRFAFNSDFTFDFLETFDVAWANSVITHLGEDMTALCLRKLRQKAKPTSRFFFTYWKGTLQRDIPYHPNLDYRIMPERLGEIGQDTGWMMTDIGNWDHPRNQLMMLATPI